MIDLLVDAAVLALIPLLLWAVKTAPVGNCQRPAEGER